MSFRRVGKILFSIFQNICQELNISNLVGQQKLIFAKLEIIFTIWHLNFSLTNHQRSNKFFEQQILLKLLNENDESASKFLKYQYRQLKVTYLLKEADGVHHNMKLNMPVVAIKIMFLDNKTST